MARLHQIHAHLLVRKFPNGARRIRLRYKFAGGTWHEISSGTDNRRRAEKFKEDWLEQQRSRNFQEPEPLVLDQLFDNFITYLRANGRSWKYIQRAEWLKSVFLGLQKEMGGGRDHRALVEGFKAQALAGGRCANGINSDLGLIKALFNWGTERSYCEMVKVKMLTPERRLARFLDETEITAFFRAIDQGPMRITRKEMHETPEYWRAYWRLVFEVYLYSGGRKEEVAPLTWGDIDFNGGLVRFTKTKTKRERWVKLEPWLMEKLWKYRAGAPADQRLWQHEGNWIYETYAWYAKQVRFQERDKCVLHCLRHTLVYLLMQAGEDIRTVAEIIGHADPALTLRVYAHVTPQGTAKAMGKLPRF